MRLRMLFGSVLLIAIVGSAIAAGAATTKKWSLVDFRDPVLVGNAYVMGSVMIVHDDEKMARGEACTTFYRFVPGKGPAEPLVSFHCRPAQREISANTVLTIESSPGCKRLIDYQFAGDTEVHGVPQK